MKRQFLRRLIQTPYNLTTRGRSVREDVRVEEERLNPGGCQRQGAGKLTSEIRRADERGSNSMIIVAGRNKCDCATVIGSIGVWMNALV